MFGGDKVFLQAIIDNFSRYLINWKITESISIKNTFQLIKNTKDKIRKSCSSIKLIMDSGTENKSLDLAKLELSPNINRVLARVDIKYSNSMVEAFFKSLKNNYLYFQKLRSTEDVIRCMKFYEKQYNEPKHSKKLI